MYNKLMPVSNSTSLLEKMRHSCAHLMAAATLELFPKTKFAIGPTIEDGFYYDFDFSENEKINEKDLPLIEKKMQELKNKDLVFHQEWINIEDAKKIFKDQPYKLEIIDEIEQGKRSAFGRKDKVSIYRLDNFVDLCIGPHVTNTKEIGPFKLLSIAGAYWRGEEKNKMLTRIYGTCFSRKEELDKYLWRLEEIKKRDHRRLGRQLELFIVPVEVGPGLLIWLPKGAVIRREIEKFIIEEQTKRGYSHVYSPHVGRKSLWVTSGHWDLYRDKMYAPMTIDGEEYLVKPMNCPMHMMVYKSKPHSYKDLPIRIAEIATVYRYEQTGELAGMLRVRHITQDDAHIFCRKDQVVNEFVNVVKFIIFLLKSFQINDFYFQLSVRDPKNKKKYLGDDKIWQEAEREIEEAVKAVGLVPKRKEGEAAFYGPKLDVMVKDALGREWQSGTVQIDFMLPERFNLEYVNEKGQIERPVLIHRAPLGSLERWVGLLTEHYAGAFPLWLSPIQIEIIPISDNHHELAQKVYNILTAQNFRAEINQESKTIGYKIRQSTLQKIPYMVIIGDKEIAKSKLSENLSAKEVFVSVRTREGKDLGLINLQEFIESLKSQIEKRE